MLHHSVVSNWNVAHLPDSSVPGIFQARLLEWVAISYTRRSSQPCSQTHITWVSCIGRQILYYFVTWEGILQAGRLLTSEVGTVCSTQSAQTSTQPPPDSMSASKVHRAEPPAWLLPFLPQQMTQELPQPGPQGLTPRLQVFPGRTPEPWLNGHSPKASEDCVSPMAWAQPFRPPFCQAQ